MTSTPATANPAAAWRGSPGNALPAAVAAGYLVLYLLLDWLSYVHPMRGTNITAWNPQGALAVALLTRYPRSAWLVAVSLLTAAALRSMPALSWPDLAASLTLTLGYVVTAWALRTRLGRVPTLGSRRSYLLFLLIVVVGGAVNTLLYVGTLAALGFPDESRLGLALIRSWTGDLVSLIVSLPAIVALAHDGRRSETLDMLRSVEWWLVAAAAMLAAFVVFGQTGDDQFKYFYMLFLPVAWAAARFGHVGAVWSAALVQGLLILAVQSAPYQPFTVFELHMLVAALGATGLLLGATVDEREQAEQALRASLHTAAASDMAAALAHELNQPLTALRTYARATQLMARQMADKDTDAPAEGTVALIDVTDKLVGEVTRAGAVVRRLRDFFRQGGTQLALCDPAALLQDVVDAHRPRAQSHGVDLDLVCHGSLPSLWIDPVQIEVVLRNLVANAIDAACDVPHGKVDIAAARLGNQLVVEVKDSGPGIAREDLAQLFESGPSSKPGGMGIGLTISRSIVVAHHGRIWAEAGPGGRFFVALPLASGEHHG